LAKNCKDVIETIIEVKPKLQYMEANKDIYKFSGNIETSTGSEELSMK
jgi:hypothetical protein